MDAILKLAFKAAIPLLIHLLEGLLKHIAALTPEEQQADVDALNAKIGGPKKFEATSLGIVVAAAKEYCTIAKL
jgi:hypothetical protein